MSLIERDYMGESLEERKKARSSRIERENRKTELWRLYGKKRKTIFDKMKIRKLEKLNLQDADN
ncbi:hypothetical protein DXD84_12010 [Dorea formicigenerans]|uniref:Uncharacterized protein n=1 Tax=Dorea formicigenerans TaxID=39486 RepID=A0A3E4F077_9FIRM|nr:hypothetical protein [Dorea formicigenerans]RGI82257.1 hypothetical protein DXD84_12010 [Dorea formicigenerans]RGI85985.1 hypothetical protein DXD82_12180 [Dorea formicigenerans]